MFSQISPWYWDGKPYDSIHDTKLCGFVYLIEQRSTGLKYIGQKQFFSKIKKKKIESNWKSYLSSSNRIKDLVEEVGPEDFKRTILHMARNKQSLNYLEVFEQVQRDVLLRKDYANEYVGGRINSKGLGEDVKEAVDKVKLQNSNSNDKPL